MKFVVAGYGSRGDIEPCAAVALELLRRGHDVRTAVTPRMLGFVESAGLAAVPYGPDSEALLHDFIRMIQNPTSALPEVSEHIAQVKADKDATLRALAEGADLLMAGITEQALAANVADSCGIPVVGLHFFSAAGFGAWILGGATGDPGLRPGIPTLILWNGLDQPIWAAAVTRLKVGSGRRFSESSKESMIADLRLILAPRYASRARKVAAQMIKPAQSRARAADLLEEAARRGRPG
jgi:UDP:flavonoid glycosyltransferase YjiC (YdhE family)